jgi:sugar O-acyltransferase (sialic acid O-acetyltransferase NeuD family)
MPEPTIVRLPQQSPNDTFATLAEWVKAAGQPVRKGEVIAAAETTKSVFEIEAPVAGFLTPLVAAGAEAAVLQPIALLSEHPLSEAEVAGWRAAHPLGEPPPIPATAPPPSAAGDPSPSRPPSPPATLKAEILARREGVDLARVPATGDRITEADVLAFLAAPTNQPIHQSTNPSPTHPLTHSPPADLVNTPYPTNRLERLLILGGGNGAVQVLDVLAKGTGQRAVAIVDDNAAVHGKLVAGVPILGGIDWGRIAAMQAGGEIDAAVIAISTSVAVRERLFEAGKAHGLRFANVIHPSCVIGMNVAWGEGNVLMALCHVGACATLGHNNFLSAYCSIEHHCVLGNHCSFGPGVVTSSRVHFGDKVRCGTGIFIEPGVTIGAGAVIASGIALRESIPADAVVKGHAGYLVRKRGTLG